MNDGEIGVIVLLISLTLGAIVLANKKLRKHALILLSIPVIGIITSAVFFVRFATITTTESDIVNTNSSQSSKCASDELVCNE